MKSKRLERAKYEEECGDKGHACIHESFTPKLAWINEDGWLWHADAGPITLYLRNEEGGLMFTAQLADKEDFDTGLGPVQIAQALTDADRYLVAAFQASVELLLLEWMQGAWAELEPEKEANND